jgi:hypothetical protein
VIIPAADPSSFTPLTAADGLSGFSIDNQHVYHAHDRGWEIDPSPLDVGVVPGADPATFQLITFADGTFSGYAKDASKVYAYYGDYFTAPTSPRSNSFVVVGADPATFRGLSGFAKPGCIAVGLTGKDIRHVYAGTQIVPAADPKTFEISLDDAGCLTNEARDRLESYTKPDYFGVWIPFTQAPRQ